VNLVTIGCVVAIIVLLEFIWTVLRYEPEPTVTERRLMAERQIRRLYQDADAEIRRKAGGF